MAKVDVTKLLAGLPEHRGRALIDLAARIKEELASAGSNDEQANATYAKMIESFSRKYKLIQFAGRGEQELWKSQLGYLLGIVDEFEKKLEIEQLDDEVSEAIGHFEGSGADDRPFGFAFLTGEEKTFIHERLDQIRKIIESSQLSVRKNNALYFRLSKLSGEVDKTGTNTDGFFAFLIDLGMTTGEMAKNAKPAINELKDVLKLLMRRRAESEGIELPAPEDFPQLPKPGDE